MIERLEAAAAGVAEQRRNFAILIVGTVVLSTLVNLFATEIDAVLPGNNHRLIRVLILFIFLAISTPILGIWLFARAKREQITLRMFLPLLGNVQTTYVASQQSLSVHAKIAKVRGYSLSSQFDNASDAETALSLSDLSWTVDREPWERFARGSRQTLSSRLSLDRETAHASVFYDLFWHAVVATIAQYCEEVSHSGQYHGRPLDVIALKTKDVDLRPWLSGPLDVLKHSGRADISSSNQRFRNVPMPTGMRVHRGTDRQIHLKGSQIASEHTRSLVLEAAGLIRVTFSVRPILTRTDSRTQPFAVFRRNLVEAVRLPEDVSAEFPVTSTGAPGLLNLYQGVLQIDAHLGGWRAFYSRLFSPYHAWAAALLEYIREHVDYACYLEHDRERLLIQAALRRNP